MIELTPEEAAASLASDRAAIARNGGGAVISYMDQNGGWHQQEEPQVQTVNQGALSMSAQPTAPNQNIQTAKNAPGPLTIMAQDSFGSGSAKPMSADQTAAIKGTWGQFLNGTYTQAQARDLMNQYGVGYNDIAAATGIPLADILAKLPQNAATNLPAAYLPPPYKPTQMVTEYPTFQAPQMPTYMPQATPYSYDSAAGPVGSYFPASYWKNVGGAYGGMQHQNTPQKFADGGVVSYDPDRVDQIYNEIKGL